MDESSISSCHANKYESRVALRKVVPSERPRLNRRRIPNVTVTAVHQATTTQFKTTTTESGEFNLKFLPVVTAQIEGFKASHENVTLKAGAAVLLDTQLQVGAVQQPVEVSAHSSNCGLMTRRSSTLCPTD